jgi:hypothetical protein
MQIDYLIYVSQPFGFDDAMLNGILTQARRNNPKNAITGALIVRADLYLQWLEGPPAALAALYERIRADDRHLAVTRLDGGSGSERRFADWAMRDDPAESWLGDADALDTPAARAAFDRMAMA